MARKRPLHLKRIKKNEQITLKCGPGENCRSASQSAINAIAAILQSENLAELSDGCRQEIGKAIRPTHLEA